MKTSKPNSRARSTSVAIQKYIGGLSAPWTITLFFIFIISILLVATNILVDSKEEIPRFPVGSRIRCGLYYEVPREFSQSDFRNFLLVSDRLCKRVDDGRLEATDFKKGIFVTDASCTLDWSLSQVELLRGFKEVCLPGWKSKIDPDP